MSKGEPVLDKYHVPVCECGHSQDMHDGDEGEGRCSIWHLEGGQCKCRQFAAAFTPPDPAGGA
jgi:hypothetical protein